MPLLGGTALEVLAHAYGVPPPRPRSVNDLDFLCIEGYSRPVEAFDAYLAGLGLTRGRSALADPYIGYTGQDARGKPIEVDLLRTYESHLADAVLQMERLLVLTPAAQAAMKRQRLAQPLPGTSAERLALDRADIQWLSGLGR